MKTSGRLRKTKPALTAESPAPRELPLKLIGAWLDFCGSPKLSTARLLSSLSTMDRRQAGQRYMASSETGASVMSPLPLLRLEVLVMSDMSINLTLYELRYYTAPTRIYTCALSTPRTAVSAGNFPTPGAGLMAYAGSVEDDGDEEDFDEDLGEPIAVSPKRSTTTRRKRQRRAGTVSATK